MKRLLPNILTLFLLLVLGLLTPNASAQTSELDINDNSEVDDSAPVARVVRLSFVEGDVSFLSAGVTEWAPVVENLPLLAGDQLYAGKGARAEIQLARGTYIRLSENTALTISEFTDSGAQFEITEGTALIRVERLSTAFHRFEVDTPNTAVVLKQDGFYRIDVRGETDSQLTVRRGEAEASTDDGNFIVRDDHRLVVDTATSSRVELAAYASQDEWDQWSYDRDATLDRTGAALSPDYVASYETDNNDFYGVSDLSSYGTWTSYSSYGQCWIPRVGADWAPYRTGQWLWIPSAGWTWLSSEPWGWAPYHYGRWAYLPGLGWAWVPGFGSPYRGYSRGYYHWRPALVFFFHNSTPWGNYVGWYPLAPGERWHRPDRDHRGDDNHDRRRPGGGGVAIQPPKHRGVTILPYEGFAGGNRLGRPSVSGSDLSDVITKGVKFGLPEIQPTPLAIAPAVGDRGSRRVAVPPKEFTKRPIVTRNPVSSPPAGLDAPRERRILTRTPREERLGPPFTGNKPDGGENRKPASQTANPQSGTDSRGERKSPKVRPPVQAPPENLNGGEPGRGGKRTNDGSSTGISTQPPKPATGADSSERENKRLRREGSQTPSPRENNSSGSNQNDNTTRSLDRRPSTGEVRPSDYARPKPPATQSSTSQTNGGPAPQAQPKQDRPKPESQGQSRSEQRQQKEQHQSEQRKKP